MVQHLHVHIACGVAAQARGQRRHVRGPVARIGHDDHVGRELVTVLLDKRDKTGAAHLLLAFDEHLDVHTQIVAQRFEGTVVDGNAAGVIARPAAVEAVTHLRAGEGVRVPFVRVGHRLYIMMRVQQHGRRFGIDGERPDDLPRAGLAVGTRGLDRPRVHAHLLQQRRHILGGTPHMVAGDALRGNGFQCDAVLHHVEDAVPIGVHTVAYFFCGQDHALVPPCGHTGLESVSVSHCNDLGRVYGFPYACEPWQC